MLCFDDATLWKQTGRLGLGDVYTISYTGIRTCENKEAIWVLQNEAGATRSMVTEADSLAEKSFRPTDISEWVRHLMVYSYPPATCKWTAITGYTDSLGRALQPQAN